MIKFQHSKLELNYEASKKRRKSSNLDRKMSVARKVKDLQNEGIGPKQVMAMIPESKSMLDYLTLNLQNVLGFSFRQS